MFSFDYVWAAFTAMVLGSVLSFLLKGGMRLVAGLLVLGVAGLGLVWDMVKR